MEWTKQLGDQYREAYPTFDFAKKQRAMTLVLKQYHQLVEPARYLHQCLSQLNNPALRVAELGGYDGTQALDVLESYPSMSWVNYDISPVAKERTRPELSEYNYQVVVLDKPFTEYNVDGFDLFYSSKTFEHMKLEEVVDTLNHTRHIAHQVHIVDWFWKDDTHVIEEQKHDDITRHLTQLGYILRDVVKHQYQSRIFGSKEILLI